MKRLVGQTYTFYVTLGEPLQQSLSIRKFNRFLRDIGLVPTSSRTSLRLTAWKAGENPGTDCACK